MSAEEIKRIEKDIADSGLPLEIEISSLLQKNGWKVRNQVIYIDKNTEKERPIDIIAHKAFYGEVQKYDRLLNYLIIECKRDKKPWVFFTTPKSEDPHELVVLNFNYHKHWGYLPLKEEITLLATHSHYLGMSKEKAVIHYEPFKGGKNEKIQTAKYQVTKCLMSELEKTKEHHSFSVKNKFPTKPLAFYFPIICFEGSLYALTFKDERLTIEPTEYLQYEFRHMGRSFLIDVVTKEFFQQYLKNVDEEIEAIRTDLKNFPH